MRSPLAETTLSKATDFPRVVAAFACVCVLIALVVAYGVTAETVELAVFAVILIAVSFVDIQSRVIPDKLLVFAALCRLVFLCVSWACGSVGLADIAFYAGSALGVGVVLIALVVVADRLFASESMGGGDVKLYAVSAWYFGWDGAMLVVLVSCIASVAVAAVVRLSGRGAEDGNEFLKQTFPFGPFIALACILVMLVSSPAASFLAIG